MHENSHELKVLMLDGATGFYRMQRYRVGDFFGPVDLGIHLAFKQNVLTIGAGLLAGSVFPGSNRRTKPWGPCAVSSGAGNRFCAL